MASLVTESHNVAIRQKCADYLLWNPYSSGEWKLRSFRKINSPAYFQSDLPMAICCPVITPLLTFYYQNILEKNKLIHDARASVYVVEHVHVRVWGMRTVLVLESLRVIWKRNAKIMWYNRTSMLSDVWARSKATISRAWSATLAQIIDETFTLGAERMSWRGTEWGRSLLGR